MKLLMCPDYPRCKKRFAKLRHLNQHIAKTGCNDGKKVQKQILLIAIGLQKSLENSIHAYSMKE